MSSQAKQLFRRSAVFQAAAIAVFRDAHEPITEEEAKEASVVFKNRVHSDPKMNKRIVDLGVLFAQNPDIHKGVISTMRKLIPGPPGGPAVDTSFVPSDEEQEDSCDSDNDDLDDAPDYGDYDVAMLAYEDFVEEKINLRDTPNQGSLNFIVEWLKMTMKNVYMKTEDITGSTDEAEEVSSTASTPTPYPDAFFPVNRQPSVAVRVLSQEHVSAAVAIAMITVVLALFRRYSIPLFKKLLTKIAV